ncbi:ABC transporter ATP-binding protein [Pedobacter aquatilis]|uniref:ABC transporter ATP-binding protein n=1 Tax=Pedobacter aquatilis TaxID=351343 RepID=UPI0029304AA5|nr:ABC transporter ATP-binding protein [Pedobacter aquatilis]
MSKNISIKVENLSKAYQLGQIGTGTISRDLERWYARLRGKEDPFLQIGESNNQNIKSESGVVWSLKDVNFEIEKGDAVGIIGRNGAGKSTLLKILSKVTAPTIGKIYGKGRIASLLEVGTGFHPELSGRENIFLNGAILGMRRKEIQRKLEEIVDFAGIERYLDTPVKRYSSGMYVRLAFAVAAHLESEILIVDEVLAVGDAEFQKKCLGKMGEVSKGDGRTVLFVSHNMSSVIQLCNNAILLDNGIVKSVNSTEKIIDLYLNSGGLTNSFYFNRELTYVKAWQANQKIFIEAEYKHFPNLRSPHLGIVIKNSNGQIIFATNPTIENQNFNVSKKNGGKIIVEIAEPKLLDGKYYISIFYGNKDEDILSQSDCVELNVCNMTDLSTQLNVNSVGNVAPKSIYRFNEY